MQRPTSPCKECEEREVGCHGRCEKYQAYRSELDKVTQVIREQKEAEAVTDGYVVTMRQKLRRVYARKKRRMKKW